MKKVTKRIVALVLAASFSMTTAGMVHADDGFRLKGYTAVDEYGRWKHTDRDKPLDWYHEWINHQIELDHRGYLDYADPTGKTWLDWWAINH